MHHLSVRMEEVEGYVYRLHGDSMGTDKNYVCGKLSLDMKQSWKRKLCKMGF